MKFLAWLQAQIAWFGGFLSDSTGKASSKRLISVIVVITFVAAYMKVIMYGHELVDIPPTWAMLIAALLGLGIYSNKNEKDNG